MDTNDKSEKRTVFKEEIAPNEQPEVKQEKTSSGLDENVAGFLCYLFGFVSGIVFLVIEKENRFIRYHAMQSIIIWACLFIFSIILTAIPILGWAIGLLLTPVYIILWIYMMWQAYKGKWFKLPIVGNVAEKQLNKLHKNE